MNDYKVILNYDIEFKKDGMISQEIYKLMPVEKYQNYSSSNLLMYSIDTKYKIEISNIVTSNYNPYDNMDYYIFAGAFVIINTKNKVNGKLYIETNKTDKYERNLSKEKKKYIKEQNLNEMHTGFEEFDKEFKLYSIDEQEIKRILSNDFIQVLIDCYHDMKEGFEILIENETIYIRIWNGAIPLGASVFNAKGDKIDKNVIYSCYRNLMFVDLLGKKLLENL